MTTGDKISKLRRENNYTQEQLAELLGVSRQAISKWESSLAYPETDKLIRLGELFDCSLDYLLKDSVEDRGISKDEFDSRGAANAYPEPTVEGISSDSGNSSGGAADISINIRGSKLHERKSKKELPWSAAMACCQKCKGHSCGGHKRHRSYCYRL